MSQTCNCDTQGTDCDMHPTQECQHKTQLKWDDRIACVRCKRVTDLPKQDTREFRVTTTERTQEEIDHLMSLKGSDGIRVEQEANKIECSVHGVKKGRLCPECPFVEYEGIKQDTQEVEVTYYHDKKQHTKDCDGCRMAICKDTQDEIIKVKNPRTGNYTLVNKTKGEIIAEGVQDKQQVSHCCHSPIIDSEEVEGGLTCDECQRECTPKQDTQETWGDEETILKELRLAYCESRDDVDTDHPKGMGCFDNFMVFIEAFIKKEREEATKEAYEKARGEAMIAFDEVIREYAELKGIDFKVTTVLLSQFENKLTK